MLLKKMRIKSMYENTTEGHRMSRNTNEHRKQFIQVYRILC